MKVHIPHQKKSKRFLTKKTYLPAFSNVCFFLLLAGLLFMDWGCGSPEVGPPLDYNGINGSNNINANLLTRNCPDTLVGENVDDIQFTGQPCSEGSGIAQCNNTCVPSSISQSSASSPNFFDDCKDLNVLCVGSEQEIETLQEAAVLVENDTSITKIKVAKGLYKENVLFKNIRQSLIIEGESADLSDGTVIESGESEESNQTNHAAIRVINSNVVLFSRFVVKGQGHGLLVDDVNLVRIVGLKLFGNALTGSTIRNVETVEVSNSLVLMNGATENKDTKIRPYSNLHFGLVVEGSKNVLIEGNEVAKNGSGGVVISTTSVIKTVVESENVTSRRLIDKVRTSLPIQSESIVFLKNNFIHHNGPTSRSTLVPSEKECDTDCPMGTYCEAGVCGESLFVEKENPSEKEASSMSKPLFIVGIGVAISGYEEAIVRGNSFFRNDVSAAQIHSIGKLTVQANSLERNGVREAMSSRSRQMFIYPALKVSKVSNSLDITKNTILDNIATSIELNNKEHDPGKSGRIQFTMEDNLVSGNGRYMIAENIPQGIGLHLIGPDKGEGIAFDANSNVFDSNGRAGFFSTGSTSGGIQNSNFTSHFFRAVVFHDMGEREENNLSIENVSVKRAHGFGIHFHSGKAKIEVKGSEISGLQPTSNSQGDFGEADAINLTNLSGEPAAIVENKFNDNERSGIFVDSSSVFVENNKFEENEHTIVVNGNQANTSGKDLEGAKHVEGASNRKNIE